MSRAADPHTRSGSALALALLAVVGCTLAALGPVAQGVMPRSADHPVHLTRAWAWAELLARRELRGWSSVWGLGGPIGELYPVLGDVPTVVLAALGVAWPTAYALAFTLAFALQGVAVVGAARCMGLRPTGAAVAGAVGAALLLWDPGAYREGGWIYTVMFGVWPQGLASALALWAAARACVAIAAATDRDAGAPAAALPAVRAAAGAAVLAALALLAHPMALPGLVAFAAIAGPLAALHAPPRARATSVLVLVAVAVAATCAGAWWWWPMLQHRGYMASYGWLWQPWSALRSELAAGRWAQAMPASVGLLIAVGMGAAAWRGNVAARAIALWGLAMWGVSAAEWAWWLRLDRVSEGFTHLQWQRFVMLGKPAWFLLAGYAAGLAAQRCAALAAGATAQRAKDARWGWASAVVACATLLGTAHAIAAQHRAGAAVGLGEPQTARDPREPSLDADALALAAFLAEQHAAQPGVWRTLVHAGRNEHWFMDLPALGAGPLFKAGFTPGDNFVHKPETRAPAVLDAARVQLEVHRVPRDAAPQRLEVARFGGLSVRARGGTARAREDAGRPTTAAQGATPEAGPPPFAWWAAGAGEPRERLAGITVLDADDRDGEVRVRVAGSGPGGRELVLALAGHPGWRWSGPGPDGQPLAGWYERPITPGSGAPLRATVTERLAGRWRGGKARGDDGSEPTLIAARVGDGEHVLRFEPRARGSRTAGVLSLVTWVLLLLARVGPSRALGWFAPQVTASAAATDSGRARRRLAHGLLLACGVLGLGAGAVVVRRVQRARALERLRALGFATTGRTAAVERMAPGLLKTDMLIRPCVRATTRSGTATITFVDVPPLPRLRGWIALDDDDAQLRRRGQWRVAIEGRSGSAAWRTLYAAPLPHRAGRRVIDVGGLDSGAAPWALRVTLEAQGEYLPQVGFDLALSDEPQALAGLRLPGDHLATTAATGETAGAEAPPGAPREASP